MGILIVTREFDERIKPKEDTCLNITVNYNFIWRGPHGRLEAFRFIESHRVVPVLFLSLYYPLTINSFPAFSIKRKKKYFYRWKGIDLPWLSRPVHGGFVQPKNLNELSNPSQLPILHNPKPITLNFFF